MIKMKSVIVLCGGQSRRMGQDKGSMNINDKPMIIHVLDSLKGIINEAIIVLNDEDRIIKYKKFIDEEEYDFEIKFVEDEIKNKGPLSGIETGLKNISSSYGLILPCDSPFISKTHVINLFDEIDDEYDCIIPYHNEENKLNTSEPLHGIYNENLISEIEELLEKNTLHVKGLIEKCKCKYIKIDNEKLLNEEFRNLNSQKDI